MKKCLCSLSNPPMLTLTGCAVGQVGAEFKNQASVLGWSAEGDLPVAVKCYLNVQIL